MGDNPLDSLHNINPVGEMTASMEWSSVVAEWNDMSGAPLEDMMVLSLLSQATAARFRYDEEVVQAMIDHGVDPEVAFDRTTNWTVWAMTLAYTAYNIGRGKEAAPIVEAFQEFVASMQMNS